MATWADDYNKRLRAAYAQRLMLSESSASPRANGPKDIAYNVLRNMHAENRKITSDKTGKGGTLSTIGNRYLEQGKNALNFLGIGNYASANFTNKVADYDRENGIDDPADVIKALLSGLGGAAKGASTALIPSDAPDQLKDYVKDNRVTYGDVFKENDVLSENPKTRAALAFGLDVLADPLTYVGPGTIRAVGRGAGMLKGGSKEVADEVISHAPESVERVTTGKADELISQAVKKNAADTPPAKAPFETSIDDKAAQLIARAEDEAIGQALQGVKTRKYPNSLDVEPFFVEEITQVPRQVKKQVTRKVETPVHAPGLDPIKAERITKRQALANNPNKAFNDPKLEIPTFAKGRTSGKMSPVGGIKPDVFRKFLETGQVPARLPDKAFTEMGEQAAKEYEDWAGQFIAQSEDQLDELFIKSPQGKDVTLRQVAKTLGVPINKVQKGVEPPKATKVEEISEEVSEEIIEDVKSLREFTNAEKVKWIEKYSKLMDLADVNYMLKAKTLDDFKVRAAKVVSREGDRRLTGLTGSDGLLEALGKGLVDEESLKPLMAILNVKTPKALVAKIKARTKPVVKDAGTLGPPTDTLTDRIANEARSVKSADEIIASVNKGDATDLLKTVNQLDKTQVQFVKTALQMAVRLNIVDPQNLEKYPYLSGLQHTKRTAAKLNEGRGRNLKGWNKYAQADVFRELMVPTSTLLQVERFSAKGEKILTGRQRSSAAYEYLMPMMRAVEDTLKNANVPMILGQGNSGLPLGMHDVLSALPRGLVESFLFDANRALLPTQFMDAAEILLHTSVGPNRIGLDLARESLETLITSPVGFRSGKSITPAFAKWVQKLPEDSRKAVVDRVVNDMLASIPKLLTTLEKNSAALQIKVGAQAKPITDRVIDQVVRAFEAPRVDNGDKLEILTNIDKMAEAVAKATGAMPLAEAVAKNDLTLKMGATVEPGVMAEVKAARSSKSPVAIAEERAKVSQEAISDMAVDLNSKIDLGFFGSVFRGINPHYKVGDLRKLYNEGHTAGEVVARGFGYLASQMSKRHAPEDIKRAWIAAQQGSTPTGETAAALDDMYAMLRSVFDKNQDYNSIKRFGLNATQLNKWMKHYGVPDMYRFDPDNLSESWRTWENVRDPLDLITRVNAAVHQAQTLRTTGGEFINFGRQAGAISSTPKPGFKRLTGKGLEQISPYIDLNLHYSSEAIEQLQYFNKFLREAQKPLAQNALLKTLDSSLHMLKAGYTIYRPGHHVRNAVGNVSLNFLAGVSDPRFYIDAARILHSTKGRYADWDKLQAIRNLPVGQGERLGMVNARTAVRVGSKTEHLTDEQVAKLAMQNGVLPDYHALEDISFSASEVDTADFLSRLPKKVRKPFGGAVQRRAGQLSQINDHEARMAHFLYELKKGNHAGKTLEEKAQSAARTVRKWHPDGTDLTETERRVMRRAILFYSWQRKIIPLVLESMVMRPGRVMVFPKAMYNFAEGMGVDLNSLADPFPQDQLFPSWLKDQATGPLWKNDEGHYIGVNPGVVQTDVLNQYGSPEKFARAILSGSIPFVKIPFELATGADVGTGAPIMDTSEYLDRQIPGVSNIGAMTNTSPVGTLAHGQIDPRREVTKGYESGGPDATAFINFLTGGGLIDMSKPNYIKSAEFELRDKARNSG